MANNKFNLKLTILIFKAKWKKNQIKKLIIKKYAAF